MKKFNKVLALGMAGSMALSMAACGGSSSSASTGTDGSSTSTAAPTAAPSKDVVTLKWVAVGSGMPSNYDAWLAQINPYLEDKIGVNIDMEVISWGDWDPRRNVIVNTSGEYDILFTNVNTYNNDVNTGAFLDITDMVKEAAPELYASVPEDYWKACEVGGRVYGVPTYKDSSQSEYVVWDKAKVEAAGDDVSKLPAYDQKSEALIPVLNHEIPLKAHAHQANDIFTAIRIAKEFGVGLTLEHVTEGHMIVDELAKENLPLAVGPTFGHASKFELQNKTWETPGVLAKAGCHVSIITDAPVTPLHYLPLCAGLAIKAGMDEYDALRAVTINPAEHIGVADHVGSLEEGKDADVVIVDGCPFDVTGVIKHVLINGEEV